MKTISGIEFASEHNGTDVFRLIELAYEQGQKDGHSEQLSTNLAEVGTDCISRQQAIDALAEDMPSAYTPDGSHPADEGIFMAQEIYADCIQTLKELPSAEPEPCDDVVSRKAVEHMLQNGFPARGMWEIEGDVVKQTVCETLADALMDLEKLPSAQPEPSWDCEKCMMEHTDEMEKLEAELAIAKSKLPEPCEDAVSRQEVAGILENADPDLYVDLFNKLPSVTPKQRTGKWIRLDMHAHLADHKCTACGQECYVPTCMGEPMYAFCPNCGAKMEVNHESN